eukprot:6988259-Prymnesium_polylepis.1
MSPGGGVGRYAALRCLRASGTRYVSMVAPGGGIGRYARPAVPLARSLTYLWPMAYDAPGGGVGRLRAPC